jgi:hypothetical protein
MVTIPIYILFFYFTLTVVESRPIRMPQQVPFRPGSGPASGGPPQPPTLSSYIKSLVDRSMTLVSHEVRRIIIDDVINYNRMMSRVEGEKTTGGSLVCLYVYLKCVHHIRF